MTDFKKWDKFDADAAEEEVERKAGDEEAERRRIAEEQRALKSCQDRAARLKSEAVVRALKAKRGSRRRSPAVTTAISGNSNSQDSSGPLDGKPRDDPASLARASADEAEAILTGLRAGLSLRDEVVAAAEAGELHRGVRKARECLVQLDAAQALLLKTAAPTDCGGDDSHAQARAGGSGSSTGGSCGGGGGGGGFGSGHGHSHAHAPHGHAHGRSGGRAGARCATEGGAAGAGTDESARAPGGRREEEESARKEMAGALEILRRAKAACRVAEGACLRRGGRAAESTETLRSFLFEDPKSVPAWVARGESFLALDAPLLAGLHFDRALGLDSGCAAAAKHKESLRRFLALEGSPSSEPQAATVAAAAGVADRGVPCVCPPERSSGPPLASESSIPSSAESVGGGGGGCGDAREKIVAVADDNAGVGDPAPAEDGAIFSTDDRRSPGATMAVAAVISSSPRGGGGRAAGKGSRTDSIDGGGNGAATFRRAVTAACESYRAGVVLHQEAFLSSSTEKFLRALELLEIATAEIRTGAVPQAYRGEPAKEVGGESTEVSCEDGGGVGGGAGAGASPSRGESFDGGGAEAVRSGAEAVRSVRVGCHLNIAAAFLLRKTDFESAVDHCTRALVAQPGNSRALVRRAQAYQELGFFRLSVEDLEAAEASVSAEIRQLRPQGEETGGESAEPHAEELAEVVKRLDHARWTKVHVGNGRDELPGALKSSD